LAGALPISLRAHANGRYVTADSAGSLPLVASSTAIGTWEQFDQVDVGGGYIALRAHANSRYVTAENAGGSPLIANRTTIGTWEKFYRTTG
jgi:glycoprotein endo-alpha-1,2-mannosidase